MTRSDWTGAVGRFVAVLTGLMLMEAPMVQASETADRMLYDFEQPAQLQAWDGRDAERAESRQLAIAPPEVTAPNQALKIVFSGTGSDWPGIATSQVPTDWSPYPALKFDVHSPNPLPLHLRIDDDKSVDHRSRFNATVQLSERQTLVQISTEDIGRSINLQKIKLLCIFLAEPPAGTTIYIDNIRLGPLEAEQVAYAAPDQRKDAPYTDQVQTPCAWKLKPLPGGPLKVFTIPSVAYGRETVELAQRLGAQFGTVTWDRNWGANTWGFGDHYGQRGHRFDFKEVQKYLTMELAGPNRYDVYVIPTPVGWKWFPKAARDGLIQRVKDGAGLVLVQPFSGDQQFDAADLWSLSALTDCATDTMQSPSGYMRVPDAGLIRGQAWQVSEPQHYVVKDLPLDLLPFKAMSYQQYKVAPDATVLVRSDIGDPIVAVKSVGKGRVVTLAYRALDVTPMVDQPDGGPPPVDYAYWEVGYALVARCVLWAAQREEPFVLPAEFVQQARTTITNPLRLEAPETVAAGQPIQVKVTLADGAAGWTIDRVELQDTFGRVLQTQRAKPAMTFPTGPVQTWAARVVAYAVDNQKAVVSKTADVVVTPPKVVWNDYEVIMWPNDRLPWQRPLIYEHMRQWGCTATLDPGWRNQALMRERLINSMRIVPHGVRRQVLQINPDRFGQQAQQWELTKDKKYLHRFSCISDPQVRQEEDETLRQITARLAPLRPLAYCIGEEDSLTSYRAELDLCFAPPTLKKFRAYLKDKYTGDLAALNRRWGTSFASWDDVMPMTSEEAKAHGNFAPWAEHRRFMDDEWADLYFFYLRILQQVDHPQALMGTSGTQVPTPHDGQDWYKVMPALNWLSSYTYGHQDEMHLHFARGKPYITAATGYGVSADRARHLLWDRLFHGNAGAIVFWWLAIQNPDLSLCQAGKDLGAVLAELKGGVGRLVFEADRLLDPIAVHYSIPSMRASWITTGNMTAYESAVDAWWVALQELGFQPRFVSSQQIEQGVLESGGFRALVLPHALTLSAKEKQQIDRMSHAGAVVLGSAVPVGTYDSDLVKHETPMAPEAYKALDPAGQREQIAQMLAQAGIQPPVTVQSVSGAPLKGLEIVRFALDGVQMVGILRPPVGTKQVVGPDGVIRHEPDDSAGKLVEPARILVGGSGLVFDVRQRRRIDGVEQVDGRLAIPVDLRGGDAALVAVVPEVPQLRLQVEPQQVQPGQDLRVTVSCTASGRRVVRLDVRQPDGSDAPWLTRNLVLKGQETVTSAMAFNDKTGQWKVAATDLLTGASISTGFVTGR